MKKLLFFIIAATTLSCSGDDTEPVSTSKITGKWQPAGVSVNGEYTANATACHSNGSMVFDPNYVMHQYVADAACMVTLMDIEYGLNGNVLTLHRASGDIKANITKLTDTQLEYEIFSSEEGDLAEPYVTYHYQRI